MNAGVIVAMVLGVIFLLIMFIWFFTTLNKPEIHTYHPQGVYGRYGPMLREFSRE